MILSKILNPGRQSSPKGGWEKGRKTVSLPSDPCTYEPVREILKTETRTFVKSVLPTSFSSQED